MPHEGQKNNDDGSTQDFSMEHLRQQAANERSRMIGPYRLLRQIGSGGMGTVWTAEQKQPVRRTVALKLIKEGFSSKDVVGRFEAERQALAMMNHQNIAKVLDAGVAEDGRPYFAMELVQGVPITEYCDRNQLTPGERLELFVPVCKAVQHAHQKGIIHRDLKPSNVLVGMYDEKAEPKVIDFGLAKVLQHQPKLTDKTMFTEVGQILGTIQYMSPEQAALDAVDIDTRTDIYALGVMLYELLTGSTPIDKETIEQNAILKVMENIREKDPPRPSDRLSSSVDKLGTICEQRHIQPAKLRQILRGDLDWIIMKSLEKDRTRRYESVTGFAKDIERYLNGEAVEARPPSVRYRFGKFMRKHRAFVGTAGTIIAFLTAGIAGTMTFAVKADRSAKRSAAVLQIVADSFESVDPGTGADATMSAKDVLLNAKYSLEDSDLDDEGRMILLDTLSSCCQALGEYDFASRLYEQRVRLQEAKLGDDHPHTLSSMTSLAEAYRLAGRDGGG